MGGRSTPERQDFPPARPDLGHNRPADFRPAHMARICDAICNNDPAKACYASDVYQKAKQSRAAAAIVHLIIAEGLPESPANP